MSDSKKADNVLQIINCMKNSFRLGSCAELCVEFHVSWKQKKFRSFGNNETIKFGFFLVVV